MLENMLECNFERTFVSSLVILFIFLSDRSFVSSNTLFIDRQNDTLNKGTSLRTPGKMFVCILIRVFVRSLTHRNLGTFYRSIKLTFRQTHIYSFARWRLRANVLLYVHSLPYLTDHPLDKTIDRMLERQDARQLQLQIFINQNIKEYYLWINSSVSITRKSHVSVFLRCDKG